MKFNEIVKFTEDKLAKVYKSNDFISKPLAETKEMLNKEIKNIVLLEKEAYFGYTPSDKEIDQLVTRLQQYIVGYGVIDEIISEMDKDMGITKTVLLGTAKTSFYAYNKFPSEVDYLNEELISSSMNRFAKENTKFNKKKFTHQVGEYFIEGFIDYKPTLIIRRIDESMIADNTLEYALLTTLLDAIVTDSNGNERKVYELISLSQEYLIKQKIENLLTDTLTNIYANR